MHASRALLWPPDAKGRQAVRTRIPGAPRGVRAAQIDGMRSWEVQLQDRVGEVAKQSLEVSILPTSLPPPCLAVS